MIDAQLGKTIDFNKKHKLDVHNHMDGSPPKNAKKKECLEKKMNFNIVSFM